MNLRPLSLVLPILMAACGDTAVDTGEERKTAAGEVLGGSISDDMLPLDTVTSQSPPLRDAGETDARAGDPARAAPRDSNEGPGEPPRDAAPAPAPDPAE